MVPCSGRTAAARVGTCISSATSRTGRCGWRWPSGSRAACRRSGIRIRAGPTRWRFGARRAGEPSSPLDLDPCGSLFVLFARPRPAGAHFIAAHPASAGAGRRVRSSCRNRVDACTRSSLRREVGFSRRRAAAIHGSRCRTCRLPLQVQGPWTFRAAGADAFASRSRALVSWTELTQPEARYYSGTAGYETEFELPAGLLAPERALWLDLGVVHEMAEVRLNGVDLGVVWKPPFTVDITSAARLGRNVLELQVTNTWRNRLIGDYGKVRGRAHDLCRADAAQGSAMVAWRPWKHAIARGRSGAGESSGASRWCRCHEAARASLNPA